MVFESVEELSVLLESPEELVSVPFESVDELSVELEVSLPSNIIGSMAKTSAPVTSFTVYSNCYSGLKKFLLACTARISVKNKQTEYKRLIVFSSKFNK